MRHKQFYNSVKKILDDNCKFRKDESVLESAQGRRVQINSSSLLNFCSNNYFSFSNDIRIVDYAIQSLKKYGFGMSSARFVCGTHTIHKQLEKILSTLVGKEAMLYPTCYQANVGVISALFSKSDSIFIDEHSHMSLKDAAVFSGAKVFEFKTRNYKDLESSLINDNQSRYKAILTNTVFSMDGRLAKLDIICDLAKKYDALVIVDDSHGLGILGEKGKGAVDYYQVNSQVDIITSTLGKSLGGACGGVVFSDPKILELLRQKSHGYLYTNALPPVVVAGSLKALDLLSKEENLRKKLMKNTKFLRKKLTDSGLPIVPSIHPIIALKFGGERKTKIIAETLKEHGIYVTPMTYPTVPKGEALIRLQVNVHHTNEDFDKLLKVLID